jgi:hypothetical protein
MRVKTPGRVHQIIKRLSKTPNFMLPNLHSGILTISQLIENSVRFSRSVHLTDNFYYIFIQIPQTWSPN